MHATVMLHTERFDLSSLERGLRNGKGIWTQWRGISRFDLVKNNKITAT
jgi:hypothetical protein